MENNNCHFQVGSLVTANLSWQLALPISIGANFGHNPYSARGPLGAPSFFCIGCQMSCHGRHLSKLQVGLGVPR